MPRELIEPHKGDKRYVRRKKGKFSAAQTEVGRSLSTDRRSRAKTIVKKGEGDRGDQPRGTKPAPHTRKAEKYQDDAKKSGGIGTRKHAGPKRASKAPPQGMKRSQLQRRLQP